MKKNTIFTRRTLSNIAVVCAGVLLFITLSNFGEVRRAITWFLSIFSPFVMGLVLAYLLNIPMRFFEQQLFARSRYARGWAIVAAYLLAFALLVMLIGLVLPQVVESVRTLLLNVGSYLNNLNHLVTQVGQQLHIDEDVIGSLLLNYNDLVNELVGLVQTLLPDLMGFTLQIGSGIVTALTAFIASIYMLAGKDKLLRQCRRVLYAFLPRRQANETMRIGRLSNGVFSGFIGGKLLDSAIIGLICFIFMSLCNIVHSVFGIHALQMPYSLLISVIIGITNVIPFFGPFLGAIPSAMILLMINPMSALWFVVFIVVLQQFDGNILGPKILGDSTGLPAMWVLVAIIVGGGLFGFAGMLLGVPTTAVLYTLASDLIEKRLQKHGLAQQPQLAADGNPAQAGDDGGGTSPGNGGAPPAPPQ